MAGARRVQVAEDVRGRDRHAAGRRATSSWATSTGWSCAWASSPRAFLIVMLLLWRLDVLDDGAGLAGGGPDRPRLRHADGGMDGDARARDVVLDHLPLHHHAALPVQRHVLPDQPAAARRPADRLADAALPRRGTDACAGPRASRWNPRPGLSTSATWSRWSPSARCSRCAPSGAAGGLTVASVPSVRRILPFGSRHSVHILERNRLIYRHELDRHLHRLLRATVLPARHRLWAGQPDRHRHRA